MQGLNKQIGVSIEVDGLDEALEKMKQLIDLLKEANELLDSLPKRKLES